MTTSETRADDLLDRLILEIKAVALLYGSEVELQDKLGQALADSHDESVRRFVSALQVRGARPTGRLLGIAVGELVLASIMVIAGTAVLVPTVLGVSSLASLLSYLLQRAGTTSGSPLSPYISFVEFVLGVVLMLSAFFALREAASNLKQSGLAIRSGES